MARTILPMRPNLSRQNLSDRQHSRKVGNRLWRVFSVSPTDGTQNRRMLESSRSGCIQADGGRLALEGHGWSLLESFAGAGPEGIQRCLGDQDVVAGHARSRLDAGRGVDRISDDGEVAPPAAADGA